MLLHRKLDMLWRIVGIHYSPIPSRKWLFANKMVISVTASLHFGGCWHHWRYRSFCRGHWCSLQDRERQSAVAFCGHFHSQVNVEASIISQDFREERTASEGIHWKRLRTPRRHWEQVRQLKTKNDQCWGGNYEEKSNWLGREWSAAQRRIREKHVFAWL